MLGSQSLPIGGVKPNYTIHPFLSGIVLLVDGKEAGLQEISNQSKMSYPPVSIVCALG